jgi:hypothetical protein
MTIRFNLKCFFLLHRLHENAALSDSFAVNKNGKKEISAFGKMCCFGIKFSSTRSLASEKRKREEKIFRIVAKETHQIRVFRACVLC